MMRCRPRHGANHLGERVRDGRGGAYRQATPEERVAFATAIEPQLLFDNVVVPAVG